VLVKSSLSARALALAGLAALALFGLAIWLLMSVPKVAVLGDRVKLPLFHGGSTWVDLMLFFLMGIAGLTYLVTKNDAVYRWEAGFRTLAAPLWVLNAVLGYIAARSTWDFSASKQSPMTVALQDPRLVAQLLLVAGVAVMILADWLVLEKRVHKAIVDVVFTVFMTVVMADIFLDPVKSALHPDSPVLNSGWDIKAPFFAMVAAIFALALVLSWLASSFVPAAAVNAPDER
jgi:hypothetical protein